MGSCCSKGEPLVSNAAPVASSTSSVNQTNAAGKGKAATTKEDQIALAFKAKRANVFTESVDVNSRRAFSAKNIHKTPRQEQIISEWFILFYFNCEKLVAI